MKYDDAKALLLSYEWPIAPRYQKERKTSENNSGKKSIGFEFPNGRQLALDTNKNTKIWIENFGETVPHDSYESYLPDDTRNSSLHRTAPNVSGPKKKGGAGGNSAYYIEIDNESELKRLLDWYSGQQAQGPNSTASEGNSSPAVSDSAFPTHAAAPEDEAALERDTAGLKTAEREAVVKVRYGQGDFRQALFDEGGEERCWMSGIEGRRLLIASHIKPWSHCKEDVESRGQKNNGLLLSALWDTAFDAGLISFEANWSVVASPELADSAKRALGLNDRTSLPDNFRNRRRSEYLAYHRAVVFEYWKKTEFPKKENP